MKTYGVKDSLALNLKNQKQRLVGIYKRNNQNDYLSCPICAIGMIHGNII